MYCNRNVASGGYKCNEVRHLYSLGTFRVRQLVSRIFQDCNLHIRCLGLLLDLALKLYEVI